MKKILVVLGLALAGVVGFTSVSFAGAKLTFPVTMGSSGSYRWAFGAMGSARSTADNYQYIGCTVHGSTTSPQSVQCGASLGSGTYLYCTSTDPTLVSTALSIGDDSYLYFVVRNPDTEAACTGLSVGHVSYYEPRH